MGSGAAGPGSGIGLAGGGRGLRGTGSCAAAGRLLALLLLSAAIALAQESPPLPESPAAAAGRAEEWLASASGPDGGYGYRKGGESFTAPTALAVLALRPGSARDGAVRWLEARQLPDGSWPVGWADREGSWMTAPACAALARVEGKAALAQKGRQWLVESCLAYRKPDQPAAGWPWTPGTAPWVEPTAWSLIALQGPKPGSLAQERRAQEAVEYLVGEMNREGGWSLYEARPYPYHTALVLLALGGLPAARTSAPAVARAAARARAYLVEALRTSSSPQDLAWGLWALSTGIPEIHQIAAGSSRLAQHQSSDGSFAQSPWLTAAALAAWRAVYGQDTLLGGTGSSTGGRDGR